MANILSTITEKELISYLIAKGSDRKEAEEKIKKIFKWLGHRRDIVQKELLHLEVEDPERTIRVPRGKSLGETIQSLKKL